MKKKNALEKAKGFAGMLSQAVQNNPGLKKAAEQIKSAVEVAKNLARTLHQAASGRDKAARPASPDTEQPTAAGMANNLSKKLPPIPIEVSEARLNQLASDAIADDSRIESLKIECSQDRLSSAKTAR